MWCWILSMALAAPVSQVQRVVLHPDAATITRAVGTTLQAGENRVVVAELPGELDLGTLRVRAPDTVEVTGLDIRELQRTEDRREAVAVLDTRLEALTDSLASVDDGLASLAAEQAFWEALRTQGAAQLSAEMLYVDSAPDSARSLAGVLAERLPALTDERRALQRQRRELERQQRAVAAERDTVASDPRWTTYEVTLTLQVSSAGQATVGLTYTTPEAGWEPRYTARGDGTGPLSLSLGALAVQTTGEDWQGVEVLVSTAAANTPLAPGDPPPFWLGEDGSLPQPVARQVGAHTFTVGRADLSGDGRTQRLELAQTDVDVTWLRVVVPRQQAAGFRVAQGAPWTGPWPLLPGMVDAWWGDEFSGVGVLGDDGRRWEVGFGIEPSLSVDFQMVDQQQRGPSFGRVVEDRSWEARLRSGAAGPLNVEVRDRLPVSTHRKVVVKRVGATPDLEEQGQVHWRLNLPAGGSTSVGWGVSVRRPADWDEEGGTR